MSNIHFAADAIRPVQSNGAPGGIYSTRSTSIPPSFAEKSGHKTYVLDGKDEEVGLKQEGDVKQKQVRTLSLIGLLTQSPRVSWTTAHMLAPISVTLGSRDHGLLCTTLTETLSHFERLLIAPVGVWWLGSLLVAAIVLALPFRPVANCAGLHTKPLV